MWASNENFQLCEVTDNMCMELTATNKLLDFGSTIKMQYKMSDLRREDKMPTK